MDKGGVLSNLAGSIKRIASACSLRVPPEVRGDLLNLQYRRVGAMVPVIYFAMAIIAGVSASASVGHFSLTYHIALPGFFLVVGLTRSIVWYRRRNDQVSQEQKSKRLQSTFILGLVISMVGSGWTLDAYFNTEEARRVLAPIFLFMISFAGAICLTSLPRTAISVLVIAMAPSCIVMIGAQDIGIRAMGISFAAIALMMIAMVAHNFAEMVAGLKLRRELKILSETDPLTGLANRRSFEQKFEEICEDEDGGDIIAVTLIDLDGFKKANDEFGHAAGDAILLQVADRLKQLCPDAACIARFGGDEFVLAERRNDPSPNGDDREQAMRIALAMPYFHDGQMIRISGSLGQATCRWDGAELSPLLKAADEQLYIQKSVGQNEAAA